VLRLLSGFIIYRNDQDSNLKRVHPHCVDCCVLTTVDATLIVTETGELTTVIIPDGLRDLMEVTRRQCGIKAVVEEEAREGTDGGQYLRTRNAEYCSQESC
jgi:hypothetical protein